MSTRLPPRGTIAPATLTAIRQAAQLLRAGDIVGMPTETVYGLAADARNPEAVRKIFAAKERPADHPLIVHLSSADQLPRWAADISKDAAELARAFWPGPLTLILPRAAGVPDEVTGGQDTVGVRVPSHSIALALLQEFGGGLAAPSANRFGRISPTTAAHVQQELGDKVALVLDGGPCAVGIESSIVDCSRGEPEILRPGAITADAITRVLGRPPKVRAEPAAAEWTEEPAAPRVSGSLAAHYAPATPLRLLPAALLVEEAAELAAEGSRVAVLAHACPDPGDSRLTWIAVGADPAAYAHALYARLRALDALGADFILVETPPADPAWAAVTDRLGRAAAGSGEADET
ncbi:L-threonylcarbamoyladenylate synthase [Pseudothauera rhizosphaerae]|uniref:Threonylcarbamoyl-AMP synthase n=1 Tax=Pseudothauera rhizosphaerae TaxID=2565932 RepID=A0A4V3WBR4_9RHOO|nr:L-threonylcarbamoyladenylate synthase [Pseudothauera rhizosphaerae]THF64286.1 threonylcarbamoyl-AMP synthase [Pseudothauera rhizosphaerae]